MKPGEWFRVLSGQHEGRWHLCGWSETAIKVESGGDEHGWFGLTSCPRCHALVIGNGRSEWAHEQWHAQTDYPLPVETAGDSA